MSRNPVSLKQRLAALAQAPASLPPAPRSPTSKRRAMFSPPWAKRHGRGDSLSGGDGDRVQEAMAKTIYQAGVDFETRPMVVLNASALPDPRDVNYDLLLVRVLGYLNLYVESDYTVVFFAAGGKNTPGWSWVWKAYRSLSRKYRKNLKRLFIVHSSFWSKMLFSLAGAMISPKFFRKIAYMDTLSELAHHVPLTQIDIPPAVYQENMRHEKEIRLPVPTRADLFGVPLEELMGYDGEKGGVPRVIKDCVQYLRETGLEADGLFRRSPSSALLRQVKDAYDRGHVVSLETFNDPYLAAVLIKKYLRDLPEPVFPEALYGIIRRCPPPTSDPADMACVDYIRDIILPELPPCVYILLSYVLHLLNEVALHAATNRMDAHNLAIVLGPNLVKGANPVRDVQLCMIPGGPSLVPNSAPARTPPAPPPPAPPATADAAGPVTLGTVVKVCIQRYYEIFDEIADRSEAVAPERLGAGAHGEQEPDISPSPSGATWSASGSGTEIATASDAGTGAGGAASPTWHSSFEDADASSSSFTSFTSATGSLGASGSGSVSAEAEAAGVHEDDEDIDDAMLVMPIGPSPSASPVPASPSAAAVAAQGTPGGAVGPPSAWASPPPLAYKARQRGTPRGTAGKGAARSLFTTADSASPGGGAGGGGGGSGASSAFNTLSRPGKARSTISIERGSGHTIGPGAGGRKGSISVGRGTTRNGKTVGAGVEAISVTAAGFFSAPPGAPPVPRLGSTHGNGMSAGEKGAGR